MTLVVSFNSLFVNSLRTVRYSRKKDAEMNQRNQIIDAKHADKRLHIRLIGCHVIDAYHGKSHHETKSRCSRIERGQIVVVSGCDHIPYPTTKKIEERSGTDASYRAN